MDKLKIRKKDKLMGCGASKNANRVVQPSEPPTNIDAGPATDLRAPPAGSAQSTPADGIVGPLPVKTHTIAQPEVEESAACDPELQSEAPSEAARPDGPATPRTPRTQPSAEEDPVDKMSFKKQASAAATAAVAKGGVVLSQAAATAAGVVKKKQGNTEKGCVTAEERAEWAERTRLEALCAHFTSQIYYGAIEVEGYEVVLSDPEPTNWKAGMVILRHVASSSLFVVFRGTADMKDVVSDVNIVSVAPYPDRSIGGLRVFGGAWNHTCSRALEDIVPAVKDALGKGVENVIFTGHSLGGACALLARFYMQTAMHGVTMPSSLRLRSISFGAPMVFAHPDPELPEEAAQVMAAIANDTVTFVNGKDIVPRLLGPKANGNWSAFFKKGNKMSKGAGAAALGGVAVASVATGGAAAVAYGLLGTALLVKEANKYESGGGARAVVAGAQKMVAVQAVTGMLSVPEDFERQAKDYFAVGTFVHLTQDGRFTCRRGRAAHGLLDIPSKSAASETGGQVEYDADSLPLGLRDHSIADYVEQIRSSVPQSEDDGAAFLESAPLG